MIEDLEHNDRKLKKLLNMNRRLHARSNVDCMYIPRVFVGRGLTSVRDCVKEEVLSVTHSSKRLLKRAEEENWVILK